MEYSPPPQSPWLSIWTRPRATIARIVGENPNKSLWLLAAIYGFSSLLNSFQSMSLGSALSPLTILILAIVISPVWGYISFSVWSAVVYWTGKWFKGDGDYPSVRASYSWSCVPLAVNVPLWLVMIALFGGQLFLNFPEGYRLSDGMITVLFFILVSKVVLAVWSLVIYINALAEVQHYSVLRAIFNIIVAGLIVATVLAALWMLLLFSLGVSIEEPKTAWLFWNEQSSLELLRRGL